MSPQCRWPGTSRQSRLTQADKWWSLSQQLRGELAIVGVEVPDSFAVGTRRAGLSVDGSAPTDPSRPSQPVAGRSSQVRDLDGRWCSRQSRPALEVTTDTHILQLRVDFYRAEAVDRTLFEAYQRRNDDSRASEAAVSLGREIKSSRHAELGGALGTGRGPDSGAVRPLGGAEEGVRGADDEIGEGCAVSEVELGQGWGPAPGRPASPCWIALVWALLLVWVWSGSVGGSTDTLGDGAKLNSPLLLVRQEYNQTAAAIDTIVGLFGRQQLERLADADRISVELPEGVKPVLLFWADDEAELFLNGNPISRSRLTPTRVEIPAFHLAAQNELLAHVWDTDRVESGFMCGLYLEDELGLLTPILTSGEREWETRQGTGVAEIFYAHPQPDIPEARVIWGDRLFGEVWLRARFTGESVRRALSRAPSARSLQPDQEWQRDSMEFDNALSRLVLLQEK